MKHAIQYVPFEMQASDMFFVFDCRKEDKTNRTKNVEIYDFRKTEIFRSYKPFIMSLLHLRAIEYWFKPHVDH